MKSFSPLLHNHLQQIFKGTTLQDKLTPWNFQDPLMGETPLPSPHIDFFHDMPGREDRLRISKGKAPFPKAHEFSQKSKRGMALHFFANHELLAIELIAAYLLRFSQELQPYPALITGMLATIQDEQKHLSLYLNRMQELGVHFGDYPLNDFFWRYFQKITHPSQFLSMLSLTFESANLDFASFYRELFQKLEDTESAQLMHTIYQDEIRHVRLGVHWCLKWKQADESLWDYYRTHLPAGLSPAKGKGLCFNKHARQLAGMPEEHIQQIFSYQDDYAHHNRKKAATSLYS